MNRREFLGRIGLTAGGLMVLQSGCVVRPESKLSGAITGRSSPGPTAEEFASPPFDCGPWVYWFWLDVNVTREGITADLEAMKRVGIAGVLIMDVDEGTPPSFNGSKFGDAQWYDLFKFACEEANRLGIEVNMTNDAGWCGSGGPWITPELSMQVVIWSTTSVAGGQPVKIQLPQPEARMGYYRDIAVLAFPTPAAEKTGKGYRIKDLHGLTEGEPPAHGAEDNVPTCLNWDAIPADALIQQSDIRDVTEKMDKHGVFHGELPPGEWTVLRFGHTTTGVNNHPAPVGGLGLETDKLSRKATLFQFEELMGRIVKKIGPLTGKTLVATHIDSWEIGVQNWTPAMRSDFERLRDYDLLPYLTVLTGRVVESLEISQRFLWDFRKTIGDLLVENYAVAMRDVAGRHGLRLSIEGYFGEPANDLWYGGEAVEPMAECWSWARFGARESVTEMVSAGHVYGRNIIGQETFTANANEKWLGHPAVVKDIGDWTFCEGINRFVFHRYAMQPWTNPHYGPGMSMGPWGLHYERTQTWWEMSKPWHDYVTRCQYMLRKGHFVADVCYMQAEGSPSNFSPPAGHEYRRPGYNYDGCPAELVLERMEFENCVLTIPGGMKYRVLVLPDSPTMTPELLKKIKKLVDAGALVIGPRPGKSPSLINYPDCDAEVQRLAEELWDGGKIISGTTAAEILTQRNVKPDFECDQPMVRWIHRSADDMDIYFVANGAVAGKYPYAGSPLVANCSFRITGARPEIWDPETGRVSPVALYDTADGMTRIPLVLPAKASVFVIFRRTQMPSAARTIRSINRNGKTVLLAGGVQPPPKIEILSAIYGKPGDPKHTRDATADVRKLVKDGETIFAVAKMAEIGGDPDTNVVKTLDINCRINGRERHLVCQDGDMIVFDVEGEVPPAFVEATGQGRTQLCVTKSGDYQCVLDSGETIMMSVPHIPDPVPISGPWTVMFPDGWGAPLQIQLEKLIPLNEHSDPGVRYFSGTATYHCRFDVPQQLFAPDHRMTLDLGNVAVMADVKLNGRSLGILWKAPFELDVTAGLLAGRNTLEIAVANLWVNRLIGDQQLPPDSERNDNGTLKQWPQWLVDGKPSPTGRFAFTTWELWRKNDAPVESGLIGPVRLVTAICRRV